MSGPARETPARDETQASAGAHRLRCLPVDEQWRSRQEAVVAPLHAYDCTARRCSYVTQAQTVSTSVGSGGLLSGLRGVGKRDLIGVVVGLPAARGRLLRARGVALSACARTIRGWSMLWLRDYARPALSTQHTCCDAFPSFGTAGLSASAWSVTSCATPARRSRSSADSARTSSRISSATPTEAPPSNASTATPPSADHAIESALRSPHGEQKRSSRTETCLQMAGFRSLTHPPSPYWTGFRLYDHGRSSSTAAHRA